MSKNNDFCSWLDAHHISSLDSIKEVELASKAIYKSKDFSVFNRLFFERVFVNNEETLEEFKNVETKKALQILKTNIKNDLKKMKNQKLLSATQKDYKDYEFKY